MRPERVLVSDLGNVLLFFDRTRTYRAIADLTSADVAQVQQAIESTGIREQYEEDATAFSNSTSFLNALRSVLADFGVGPIFDLDKLKNAWCSLFWENRYVHKILRHMKESEHVPLILLSDTNELHYESFRTRFQDLHELFDVEILSFRAGMSKRRNARAMLRLAIVESGLLVPGIRNRDVLYIDDQEEFVDAAKSIGIDAITYSSDQGLAKWLLRKGYSIPKSHSLADAVDLHRGFE